MEAAFKNFQRVASSLCIAIYRAFPVWGTDQRMLEPFYKTGGWIEQSDYKALGDQYDWIVDVIHVIALELTRAANLVLYEVRRGLDFRFRLEEGDLVVERGDGFLAAER